MRVQQKSESGIGRFVLLRLGLPRGWPAHSAQHGYPAVGGPDSLWGGAGRDSIHAGAGNDVLHGDGDDDALFGGTGDDSMIGGSGGDRLYGGFGADWIDGGSGSDIGFGGDGNDSLVADLASDRLIDWLGNQNRFDVPTPAYGAKTIVRAPGPCVREFLVTLRARRRRVDVAHDERVPHEVQAHGLAPPRVKDEPPVASSVVVAFHAVQQLLQVADEMNHEF